MDVAEREAMASAIVDGNSYMNQRVHLLCAGKVRRSPPDRSMGPGSAAMEWGL